MKAELEGAVRGANGMAAGQAARQLGQLYQQQCEGVLADSERFTIKAVRLHALNSLSSW